jgi:hypothetical protein
VPAGAETGQYTVAAQASPDDTRLAGGGAVGTVEDVVTVFVGDSAAVSETLGFGLPTTTDLGRNVQLGATDDDVARLTGLDVSVDSASVVVSPGGAATVTLSLANRTRSAIRGEVQVASPWGTWEWIDNAIRGFAVDAGQTADLEIEIAPPADATPGHAWLMAKVMWFGRAQYAETVRLEVRS